jgi:predicted PurR-regulated permease PerM
MEFSLDQFWRINRRAMIWIILLALLWFLRDFFALIFLTFVIGFIAAPLIALARRRSNLPRRLAVVLVFSCFALILVGFVRFVTPTVISEAETLLRDLKRIESKLIALKEEAVADYPSLAMAINGYIESILPEEEMTGTELTWLKEQTTQLRSQLEAAARRPAEETGGAAAGEDANVSRQNLQERLELENKYERLQSQYSELLMQRLLSLQANRIREQAPMVTRVLWRATATMLLALFLSFLIYLDLGRLGQEIKSLRASRLHDFYEEAAQPVVRFAYVVGRAFQAQAMIACVNTALTLVGMIILGLPSLAMLSLIVFVCSFIPVLGVFISTIPIVLVAINTGGVGLAVAVVVMVFMIHTIEAYVLNPLIYGRHMQLNPVLVLIILFVGHHLFGLWGLLLGVPVAHYFLHDVFGVPIWGSRRLAPAMRSPAGEEAALALGDEDAGGEVNPATDKAGEQ